MSTTSTIIIGLLVCHFLADYTHLSTTWMLNAKKFGKPLIPILTHALVHASLMVLFLLVYSKSKNLVEIGIFFFFFFQLLTHFLIDLWKGRMNGWFPTLQDPANKWHWIVFGFDQFLHALVIVIMLEYYTTYC